MNKQLNFKEILTNAFAVGLKNFPSLIGAVVLWILTLWIPYVNVGTTVAIATIPALLSRGEVINPLSIFDGKYRKFMGEYFLVTAFKGIITSVAAIFLFIPAIVMKYTYMFSTLLVIDKEMGASESLAESNKLTYGNKWAIFFAHLVLTIPFFIFSAISGVLGGIYLVLLMPFTYAANGYIYGVLTSEESESTPE